MYKFPRPYFFLLLSMRYLIPTGHLFPQPNLRFLVRLVSPFKIQKGFYPAVQKVGHNTVLLMHLGAMRCTRSCPIAPVCSGDIACVKSNGVRKSQRTDLAVCTDELRVPLDVEPYNTLLIVHVDGISGISSIPNGYWCSSGSHLLDA